MRVTFDQESVEKYQFANGGKPSGAGYYGFEVVYVTACNAASFEKPKFVWAQSFTEAKRSAMRSARREAPGAAVEAVVRVCQ